MDQTPTKQIQTVGEFEKQFIELINGWKTFGAEEDPENFSPYISFDRQHDFTQWFIPKFRKLVRQFKKDVSAQTQQEAVESERKRIVSVINKMVLTKESIANFEDNVVQTRYGRVNLTRDKLQAKEMEGAYNAALLEVVESLNKKGQDE